MNQIFEATGRRRYINLGQKIKKNFDYSWQLEEEDTTECRQVGWWGASQGVLKYCQCLQPYLCGTITKLCQIAGPWKRGKIQGDRDGCRCGFCGTTTKGKRPKTVRQFKPIDSFANTRLQKKAITTLAQNFQHPHCDYRKLVKAALHMDRDQILGITCS